MGGSSSTLSSTDLAFLTSNTGMQEEEVNAYFQKFKKTGDPRKAKISKAEFCQIMSECYPRTYKPELAEDIFRIYDRDGNGCVEFTEFLVIICVMSEGSKEEKLKHIFRIFDRDGSGSISQEEVTSIVSHLYHLIAERERGEVGTPEQFSQIIMQEMDRNKDGKISEEELMEAFLRQEMLTTLLVNKVMQRAVTAKVNILKE